MKLWPMHETYVPLWNTALSVGQRVDLIFPSRQSLIKQLGCAKSKIKLAQFRQMHSGQGQMGVEEGWLYRDDVFGVLCTGL